MKRALPYLILVILVTGLAYGASYLCCTSPVRALTTEKDPELAWLKTEFALDDAAYAKVAELHQQYLPHCRETCSKISATNKKISEALASSGQMTPEIEQLMAEAAALRLQCQSNMLTHFLAVSKTMPADQASRYLDWVSQSVFGSMHEAGSGSCPACKK